MGILNAQDYQRMHHNAVLVDTHNDILMKVVDLGLDFDSDLRGTAHSDLSRMLEGGIDVQVFSIYCDGDVLDPFALANREMDSLDAAVSRNPDKIVKVGSYDEIMKAIDGKKMAALFGVEGGHMIEDNLDKLSALYQRGARYLTLTHNISPSWVSSAMDETLNPEMPEKGLTDFGKQVIRKMNSLGMLIDVSHLGDHAFWEVITLSSKPIFASHSSVYSLVPHRRNLKDDQIKAIAKNGGVIQVNFHPGFIDSSFEAKERVFLERHAVEMDSLLRSGLSEFYVMDTLYRTYSEEIQDMRPPLSMLIQHIEYIINLVGVDYVGLGSDFDGINLTPQLLEDVTSYPMITKALIEKGYSEADISKILGGNFLRVLKANESKNGDQK